MIDYYLRVFLAVARTCSFTKAAQALNITQNRTDKWSEPLRVDNELSNINSWREVHEKDEAALRPSIQDISSS